MAETILTAGLFVFVAHLLDVVFQKTRIPDILLLMMLGAVAGPVFGFVDLAALGKVGDFLAVVTLVVILTESGLSLHIRSLRDAAARALPFSLLSMGGAVALITVVLHVALGLDWWTSTLGGFIMGGTSSSVVIPMLKGLGTSERVTTILTLESALTDVLCIIAAVGIATGIASGQEIETGGLLGSATFSLVAAMALGAALGVCWAIVLSVVGRMRDGMFTTFAFALVVYGAAELVGISGAIAALSFGIALGNVPKDASIQLRKHVRGAAHIETIGIKQVTATERRVYAEVVFLLKAFFFFYLGMTMNPAAFGTSLGLVALALAAIPFWPRYPVVMTLLRKKKTTRHDALTAWALVPRGLAAAVLAQVPVQMGLPHATTLASVVAMAVFASITFVAIIVLMIERGWLDGFGHALFRRFPVALPDKPPPADDTDASDPKEPE